MVTLEKIIENINDSKLTLVVGSTKECSVCNAIKPKIEELMSKYKNIDYKQIYIDSMLEASGKFMIFTVPTIILYSEGKEIHRQGRFIDFEELEFEISRWHDFVYKQ